MDDTPSPRAPHRAASERPSTPILLRSGSPADTEAAGEELGRRLGRGDVVSLTGPLGCGKTVFVKGIARALGVLEQVTSPSFVIAQEYGGRVPFCHMDLYRLQDGGELDGLGFRDLLSSGSVVAIEWGEKAGARLPSRHAAVTFRMAPDGSREITIEERT